MINPRMTLSEVLRRYEGAAALLDDLDVSYDSDDDADTAIEDICDDSGVDYWEIEEEFLLLDERRRSDWDETG